MKVVDPNDLSHSIELIPRTYQEDVVLDLYNEVTKVETTVVNTSSFSDGIFTINFDFTFAENDKYQIKISKGTEIIYRGKLIATTQEPQKYKLTKDLFYYG